MVETSATFKLYARRLRFESLVLTMVIKFKYICKDTDETVEVETQEKFGVASQRVLTNSHV